MKEFSIKVNDENHAEILRMVKAMYKPGSGELYYGESKNCGGVEVEDEFYMTLGELDDDLPEITLTQLRELYAAHIDPKTKARATDPDTSHMAAKDAVSTAKSDQREILKVMREKGMPMTADEIAVILEWETHRVNRRTSELIRANLIKDNGDRRAFRSGRKGRVLEIVK